MNINNLPIELLEKIFTNLNYETKIELVCNLWCFICKKKIY